MPLTGPAGAPPAWAGPGQPYAYVVPPGTLLVVDPATGQMTLHAAPDGTGYPPVVDATGHLVSVLPGGYTVPAAPPGSQDSRGLVAMILGIVSIVAVAGCRGIAPLLVGIAAVVVGSLALRRAAQGLATNRGQALAGVICGAAGAVLGVASFLWPFLLYQFGPY
jgi:hypothetical protein